MASVPNSWSEGGVTTVPNSPVNKAPPKMSALYFILLICVCTKAAFFAYNALALAIFKNIKLLVPFGGSSPS